MSQPPYPPPDSQQPWGGGDPSGQHGQPGQYGQQQYGGPPPYQQQPYGQPPTSNKNTVIALTVGAVVVIAAIVVGLVVFLGNDDEDDARDAAASLATALSNSATLPAGSTDGGGGSVGGPAPDPTVEPDGLGDDPALDELAQQCYDGQMQSCDDLFRESDIDSAYETYGDTCAGRQPENSGYCTVAFADS